MPNTLDHGSGVDTPLEAILPAAVIARAASITHWVVEDARSARAFLKRVDAHVPLARPLQAQSMVVLPRPAKGPDRTGSDGSLDEFLAPTRQGHDLGLLSEAGLPALADPGAALVAAAHASGVTVEALPGSSSLALAIAASGLHGQSFTFVGYLPVDGPARARRIRDLDDESARLQRTIVAIETPYRNRALMEALLEHLSPDTKLAIACGLTLPQGSSVTRSVARWRAAPFDFPADHPAIFAWLRAAPLRGPAGRPAARDQQTGQDAHHVGGQVHQRRRP
jgi:16S rRNA (cytidine1402-2'-O)-methyltransferase